MRVITESRLAHAKASRCEGKAALRQAPRRQKRKRGLSPGLDTRGSVVGLARRAHLLRENHGLADRNSK